MDTFTRMQAFVEVVDEEGFSAAARKLGRSKALMSRYVRELEDDLGILLLNRTTRQFSLTEAGQQYYDSAMDILRRLADMQETVRETGSGLRGRLRVSAPRSLTDLQIGLPFVEFADEYPDITLELNLDDRIVNLVDEGYDVAIRISRLTDSGLIARKLGYFRLMLCASPDFIARHGSPETPRDLVRFPAIVDTNWKGRNNWIFLDDEGREATTTVNAVFEVNSPEVAKRAALAGLGLTVSPEFSVGREIREGSLISLLENRMPTGGGVYAVYPHRRLVPAKVRVFVDFMAKWFRTNAACREQEARD